VRRVRRVLRHRSGMTLRYPCSAKRPATRRTAGRHHPRYFYGGVNLPNDAHSERVPQHRQVIMRAELRRESHESIRRRRSIICRVIVHKAERAALPTKAAAKSEPRMRRP
jgi:hypothetical protein